MASLLNPVYINNITKKHIEDISEIVCKDGLQAQDFDLSYKSPCKFAALVKSCLQVLQLFQRHVWTGDDAGNRIWGKYSELSEKCSNFCCQI